MGQNMIEMARTQVSPTLWKICLKNFFSESIKRKYFWRKWKDYTITKYINFNFVWCCCFFFKW